MRGCVKKVFAFWHTLSDDSYCSLVAVFDRAISPYIIIGSASMNGGYGGRLGL